MAISLDEFCEWAIGTGQVSNPNGSYPGQCVSLIATTSLMPLEVMPRTSYHLGFTKSGMRLNRVILSAMELIMVEASGISG